MSQNLCKHLLEMCVSHLWRNKSLRYKLPWTSHVDGNTWISVLSLALVTWGCWTLYFDSTDLQWKQCTWEIGFDGGWQNSPSRDDQKNLLQGCNLLSNKYPLKLGPERFHSQMAFWWGYFVFCGEVQSSALVSLAFLCSHTQGMKPCHRRPLKN